MTSAINPLYPVQNTPTTASVRANFNAAKNEIEAAQARLDALEAKPAGLNGFTATRFTLSVNEMCTAGHQLFAKEIKLAYNYMPLVCKYSGDGVSSFGVDKLASSLQTDYWKSLATNPILWLDFQTPATVKQLMISPYSSGLVNTPKSFNLDAMIGGEWTRLLTVTNKTDWNADINQIAIWNF